MKTPFTTAQFVDVFREYNETVFPMKVVLFLMAAIAAFLVIRKMPKSGAIISIILAFFWLWMGTQQAWEERKKHDELVNQ